MARLLGLIGNRPDLAGRVLALEAASLRVQARAVATEGQAGSATPLGWGIGFYQGGEVLMRRRPLDDREVIDLGHLAADLRADVLLGHVRSATVGALRNENTHPFRYRQWLFAQTGTLTGWGASEGMRARLMATVPDFLRGNIRGETDAELVFHVFLSFLHDSGKLAESVLGPADVAHALRATLGVLDGLAAEALAPPSALNILVTNGEALVAVRRNSADAGRMYVREFSGKVDADLVIGDDAQLRRRAPELARMHFSLVVSDVDDELRGRWKLVDAGSLLLATRAGASYIEPL